MGVQRCVFAPPCADAARNPYPGLLAWADVLLVSADSVSMLSEAAATARHAPYCAPWHAPHAHALLQEAKGVYAMGTQGAHGKVSRFLAALVAGGAAWPLEHPAQVVGAQRERHRLLEAHAAAAAVHDALAARSTLTDAQKTVTARV
jgi:hypothetical protein